MRGGHAALLTAALLGCAAAEPGFRVIAHRGASAYAPENTLPAFEIARAQGAREVELDVQLSRDGAVVLFHDATLDEKTDARGAVRDHDASALARVEIGRWFDANRPGSERRFSGTRLATLEQVFEQFGSAFHYHVEMKSREPELPGRILALAKRHALASHLTLTSFHREQLARARALAPGLELTWLLEQPGPAAIDRAAREGFGMVGVRARELTPELVERARARGLAVRAWKVATPELLDRALAHGAAGASVDWPDRALERLRARPP